MRFLNSLIVALLVMPLVARSEDMAAPKRKPGLWEVSVIADGRPMPMGIKQCADETTDAQMMQMSEMQSESCKVSGFSKTVAGHEFSSECEVAGSKITSKGSFTGDFEKEYQGEIVTTVNPPMFGQSGSKSTISAKWLGACPSGMKAGDMQMGNGETINLEQAKQGAKMAAEMMKNPELQRAMKNAMAGGAAKLEKAMQGLQAGAAGD